MNLRIRSGYLLLLTLPLLLVGCYSSKLVFQNGKDWIPPDFDPTKTTILIQEISSEPATNKKMFNYMKKNYPYKFEMATFSDVQDTGGKYNCRDFPYALVCYSSTKSFTNKKEGTTTYGTNWDFNFLDRREFTNYKATGKSNAFQMAVFVPAINTIIKQFAPPKK